jgi:hypothetical protein
MKYDYNCEYGGNYSNLFGYAGIIGGRGSNGDGYNVNEEGISNPIQNY